MDQKIYDKYHRDLEARRTMQSTQPHVPIKFWRFFCCSLTCLRSTMELRWENWYQQFEKGRPWLWWIPKKFPSQADIRNDYSLLLYMGIEWELRKMQPSGQH